MRLPDSLRRDTRRSEALEAKLMRMQEALGRIEGDGILDWLTELVPIERQSIPHRAELDRARTHRSMPPYSASLRAKRKLGRQTGDELVCCNSAGNNAFSIWADVMPPGLQPHSVEDACVRAKLRESRDEIGRLGHLDPAQEERLLGSLQWVEV
jgi:hypothetical protein